MLRKRISSLSIIQRVISEFGISNFSYRDDAIEWIGDAIQEIGCYTALVNRLMPVTIVNGVIEMPYDLFELNRIIYNGKSLRYGYSTPQAPLGNMGTIDYKVVEDLIKTSDVWCKIAEMPDVQDCATCPKENEKQLLLERMDLRLTNLAKQMMYSVLPPSEHWYSNDSDGYKFWNTDIKEGVVLINYKAFPIDEYGYPYVYDEINTIQACKYYVLKCILHRGYKHPTVDLQYAEANYQSYLRKAYTNQLVMTPEQLQDFKTKWTDFTYVFKDNHTLFKTPNFYNYGLYEQTSRWH